MPEITRIPGDMNAYVTHKKTQIMSALNLNTPQIYKESTIFMLDWD